MITLDLTVFEDCCSWFLCCAAIVGLAFVVGEILLHCGSYLIERLKLRHFKAKVKIKFNMSDFNIKPCPFCGCRHIKVVNKHFLKFEQFALKCAACDMGTSFGSAAYIVSSWNNRANESED